MEEVVMPDDFEYISRARLEYQGGYRRAYLGEVAEPVVYGVQGRCASTTVPRRGRRSPRHWITSSPPSPA